MEAKEISGVHNTISKENYAYMAFNTIGGQTKAKTYIYGKHTIGRKVYIYISIYVYIDDIANRWFSYVPPLKPLIAIIMRTRCGIVLWLIYYHILRMARERFISEEIYIYIYIYINNGTIYVAYNKHYRRNHIGGFY